MRRFLAVAAAAVVLTGCGSTPAGQQDARAACAAYANILRHPTATTVAQADAVRAEARDDARRAAEADDRWRPLQRDIADFLDRMNGLQHAPPDQLAAYFAADRRVQADCTAAGRDIGPLKP